MADQPRRGDNQQMDSIALRFEKNEDLQMNQMGQGLS